MFIRKKTHIELGKLINNTYDKYHRYSKDQNKKQFNLPLLTVHLQLIVETNVRWNPIKEDKFPSRLSFQILISDRLLLNSSGEFEFRNASSSTSETQREWLSLFVSHKRLKRFFISTLFSSNIVLRSWNARPKNLLEPP
jgi:hypothetical protein